LLHEEGDNCFGKEFLTADINGVVERVGGVGCLIIVAVAGTVRLEWTQVLITFNLRAKVPSSEPYCIPEIGCQRESILAAQ